MRYVGRLIDVYGPSFICKLGCPVVVLSLFFLLSKNELLLITGSLLLGVGWCMAFLSANKFMATQPGIKHIKMVAHFDFASHLATALGILLAGMTINKLGYESFLIGLLAINIAIAVIGLLVIV